MTSKGAEKMITCTIGVDISKDTFDVYRLSDGATAKFANDKAGIKRLLSFIVGQASRVVFEPTGPYHRLIEQTLSQKGIPFVKVNPRQARRFAEATGKRAKTDPIDAANLARMGALLELEVREPISENARDLKDLHIAREALIKDRTAAKNRLQSVSLPLLKRQSAERLKHVERQIEAIEAEIEKRINADPDLAHRFEIITSIPGISRITAFAILIQMPELGRLDAKAAASLAGLAPQARQSGRWVGHAFVCGGRACVRHALYMPALVAARCNKDLKAVYDRLIKAGKPAKVALTALMRKLIVLANALLKADRKWEPKCP